MTMTSLRGQDDLVRAFERAWASGKLHHALLVDGPLGVGKSLFAREAASLLLCDTPQAHAQSCGQCRSCRLYERGNHPDFLWIEALDGKKSIAVAQIRELRGRVEYPPHQAEARVVVIDEADRMTIEAQNALLKTLEEPPSRTFLLLTTANASRLLPTVRSRCVRFRLAPLQARVVAEILEAQLPEVPRETLSRAASLSQGSVTAALSLAESDLDESEQRITQINHALNHRQVVDLLRIAEDLARAKGQIVPTLELLVLFYRDVVVAASSAESLDFGFKSCEAEIRETASALGVAGAAKRMHLALQAIDAVTNKNANARLTGESMLLRMLA